MPLWDAIADLFCKEAPRRIGIFSALVEARQADELAKAAHTFGGSAANLGATALRGAVGTLEASARSGDWDGIKGAAVAIEREWERLHVFLKTYRENGMEIK
jgi:histidine phosphotransfer protein HptB